MSIMDTSCSGVWGEGVLIRLALLLVFVLVGSPSSAEPCGGTIRCEVEGGYYLVAPPLGWDGFSPVPVVVFFHGWNSSPEGTFRNRAMINAVTRRGAVFVAPYAHTGYWRQIGPGRAEAGRDELAYVRAVMEDIEREWPVDRNRTLASGFSRGASLVWNLACYGGSLFHAFAPIAGGFWNSTPQECPSGPVNLRHIHGKADRVVAYDKIGIYNSMPIPEGLKTLRALNGCGEAHNAVSYSGQLVCRGWKDCASGKMLELCLHDRGHSIRAEWVAEGFDWMMNLPE
jgi:polyhydroxybutyrate depolymerase